MALPDGFGVLGGFGFLTPLGFVALAALVPVVVLYLVQPDPRRVRLPTLQFLLEEGERDASNPLLERLRRSLLLLLQLLVLVLLATSLATPYVPVSEQTTVEETVVVVDGSASMATQADGSTRFARAVAAARDATTGTTSVVFAASESRIVLRQGTAADAGAALDGLSVTDAEGNLRTAISEAAAIAGENAQILVFSDFADATSWEEAVRSARARGLRVDLRQFAGGGADNVGIVDRSFSGTNVTVTVKNFGESRADRTLTLGNQRRSVSLAPDDVTTATFAVPAGGGALRMTPGDSFPTDDVVYVSAPPDATVDVLLLTNDRNRYLAAALSVIDAVSLTVESPPTAIESDYDVVIYSNLRNERLLRGNVEAGRDAIANGGGVAIQAQREMPDKYGDLLLLSPTGTAATPTLAPAASDDLTRGINFPPPEQYVTGSLREGRSLVETQNGTPIVATARRGGGRVLYYGFVEEFSTFKYNYQYPVFWKRAVYYLAGRDPLAELNRETGVRLQFGDATTVGTPDGTVTASTLVLDRTGFYEVGNRRLGVSLVSDRESSVNAQPLSARADGGVPAREEDRTVPRPLSGLVALAALVVALGEVVYLRKRGDL
ncbi:MAG: BatA domain-containing protein [Haloferacaceae archaeon]